MVPPPIFEPKDGTPWQFKKLFLLSHMQALEAIHPALMVAGAPLADPSKNPQLLPEEEPPTE